MKLYLVTLLLALAGCAATPSIPPSPNGKNAVVACARLTSIYGVGTVIQVDLDAPRAANAASITTDGNDCKTTVVFTGPAKAASAP
jgi:hypothetical protein